MRLFWVTATLALLFQNGVESAAIISHLTDKDLNSFKTIFSNAVNNPPDVAAAFYGAGGLFLLNEKVPDHAKLCALLKKSESATDIDTIFHASALAFVLDNCKYTNSKAADVIKTVFTDAKSTQELYFAASAEKYLGLPIDHDKIATALAASLKKDDSAGSLGYAFHAGTLLEGKYIKQIFDRIEDCVAQGDEVDGKYLQFEGGVSVSSVAISGIYALAEKANKTPNVKADEAVKLSNYLLNHKGVPLVRPAYHVLRALRALTTNHYQVPVSFSLASPLALSHSQKVVRVKVCDLLGKSVGSLTVTVDKATHVASSGVVLNKKQLTAVADDPTKTLYEFNFMEQPREKGFYVLTLSAASPTDKRLIGTQGAELTVKVMTEVTVDDVEVAVVDREQTGMGSSPQKIASFTKLGTALEADVHQKVILKFSVKDKTTNQLTKVHQAFVIFTHTKTGQEIVFVAEADSSKVYKFDADLQKSIKDFDYVSGKYGIKLVLGDSVVNNAINWVMADITLKFPEHPSASQEREAKVSDVSYEKKPEIQHMFRAPEKRPPQVVSDSFTGLVLLPLLILFILWLRIGVNISNFPFSLYAVAFHLGLTAIFGLYLLFWLKLNMFQTLKYLAIIGSVTFFCGNRMLRGMAERQQQKAKNE